MVEVELFSALLESPDPLERKKSLWDLEAGAQTRLIQILDARYPANEGFQRALKRSYIQEAEGPGRDHLATNLRMVFSVSKHRDYVQLGQSRGRYSPADRIEYLRIGLQLPPGAHVHFTGWNRYATEYATLDIGEVSFSRSIDLDAQAESPIAEGGMRIQTGKKEDQAIRSRHMALNGKLSPTRLELEEEGNMAADLAGNILADVAVEFDAYPEKITVPVFRDESGTGFPELIRLDFTDLMIPRMEDAPGTLFATLDYEFIYRHVESGWKTYQEFDDRVAYFRGKGTREVPLMRKPDYTPLIYGIVTTSDPGIEPAAQKYLRVQVAGGTEYPLRFADLDDAGKFNNWLYLTSSGQAGGPAGPVEIGDSRILLGDQPLTWKRAGDNPFRVTVVY